MFPKKQPLPRHARAVHRARLARIAAAGALAVLPACGTGDKEVFDQRPAQTAVGTDTLDSLVDSVPVTTLLSETSPVVPAGVQMVVSFTYSAGADDVGRPIRNPYIAVWVEDSRGNLVQTISAWYQQTPRGLRYLNHLRSWYTQYTESGAEPTISGATRGPGTYTVAWDGTGLAGKPVAQGDYVLFVEAAREQGPYSFTSTPVTLGTSGFGGTLPADGELSALTVEITV
ncbi:MAG: DUF2271 domain-containing protein [Actinobacteria bacterium]|nr:DUF2271 domain-containing protein [Actinomycetota bacterium]MSY12301.1 DUF2271 domain-containing protein [Actinomycetota bacterium]MSZ03354.1 DUF2271 domain-containing protein [Actinomycetota bacterium]MTB07421.1 DUF2271 domain-containing protein [Actinomycetota bacterium]